MQISPVVCFVTKLLETLKLKNLPLKNKCIPKGINMRQTSFFWCWTSFEAWSCMWLTTQLMKTLFFSNHLGDLKKKLDSLIALTICTEQTFPIRQTQQSATPTTSSPGRYSISLKLHRGKPASSQGQNITWVQKCTGTQARSKHYLRQI